MPKQPNRPRRSTLSVPGSSPKMIAKAATLPVDQVLLDLEDAVAVDAKIDARATVIEALNQQRWTAHTCLLYTSPSPRDRTRSRMPSSA